ncbi:MAG: hypothetical protein Kow0058_03190 [Roseovarius sp.]
MTTAAARKVLLTIARRSSISARAAACRNATGAGAARRRLRASWARSVSGAAGVADGVAAGVADGVAEGAAEEAAEGDGGWGAGVDMTQRLGR